MTTLDRHPSPGQYDGSMDFNIVSTILRRRKKWILLGTVIGLVICIAYLLIMPTTYTATARVSIAALGSEPVTQGRSAANLVDMPTERQLASSALTAEGAVEELGEGWKASELRSGLSLSGDPESTVLELSYSANDRLRSIEGADALARAFLVTRSNQVTERAQSMVDNIDEKIAANVAEKNEISQGLATTAVAPSVRIATIDATIAALQQQRATWSDINTWPGEVITPASSNEVKTSPVIWRVIALGLLAGLFLGFVMAALRHAFDGGASHADDIRSLLNVRLLRPQAPYGEVKRWDAAATIAHHGNDDSAPLLVLVDEDNSDAEAAAQALAAAGETRQLDLRVDRATLLRELGGETQAVLVVPPTWKKTELLGLVDDLDGMGTHLVGAIVVDERAGRTTAATR